MDHSAGPRVACVTLLTMLLVFLLSAIAIVLRLDDRTAGALRAALACLIFPYVAYLLFELKVLQLFSLLHLAPGQGQPHENWYYPPPPLSFVGTFSPLGSSVGHGLSPEEAGGGPASPSPSSEAGYRTSDSDSEHVPETSPYFVSVGDYHRRRLYTRIRRSSRRLGTASSSTRSSSEVADLASDQDLESWMDRSSAASWSPSRAGGTMTYTELLKRASR